MSCTLLIAFYNCSYSFLLKCYFYSHELCISVKLAFSLGISLLRLQDCLAFDKEFHAPHLIEGFSNDALMLFTALAGLVVLFVINAYNGNAVPHIHPDLLQRVQDFRNSRVNQIQLTPEEIERRIAEARARADNTCAICYGTATYAVLTNCGHIFCCECINGYWSHSGNLVTPINCAICRTPVTMLLPIDWPSRETAEDEDGLLENTIRLDDYNRRFSGDRPWIDYLADLPVLIPYVLRNLLGFNGLMIMFRLRVILIAILIVAYILSPFDMIPESAYGLLGWLDDLFVVLLMMVYISIAIRHFLARRGEVHVD